MNHASRGELWENFVYMEYIKTRQLQPGRQIFFYRDTNGVEIDFVIEAGGRLELIEAKATERVDERKLNFNKVSKLFANTSTILACMINESRRVNLKDYIMLNPLFCDLTTGT